MIRVTVGDMETSPRRRRSARPPRAYRQEKRAHQADANTERIVAACVRLIKSVRRMPEITLDDMARESGVTVRTVLRRFGSRDGAFEAAFSRLESEIKSLRRPTPPGDVDAAVASLVDQYEQMGDLNIRALEAEDQLPLVHRGLETGRRAHREWLAEIFAPCLARRSPHEKARRLVALYAATDIYVWKLLRRDLKFDREVTRDAVCRMVRGVLAPGPDSTRKESRRDHHAE
jgi:AcrR family transcriptional regulator